MCYENNNHIMSLLWSNNAFSTGANINLLRRIQTQEEFAQHIDKIKPQLISHNNIRRFINTYMTSSAIVCPIGTRHCGNDKGEGIKAL